MTNIANIWIIEDDPDVQKILNYTLRGKYTLRFFSTGRDALDEIEQNPCPDLILLDILMADLDGYEVLQRFRNTYDPIELPIILLSAISDKDSITAGIQLGANDYVTKPYHPKELLVRIESFISISKLMQQNQTTLQQLEALDELKDQALMIVSHDLKGPVSTFQAGLQMLTDIEVQPQDRKFYQQLLKSMTAAVQMMEPLIEEFLDLQAIKSQQVQLSEEVVNLNLIVEDVVEQYRNLSQRQDIEIIVKLEDMLPDSVGDPLRLKQVVSNLLNNALKYSPPGSSTIIRTASTESTIRVEVIDNGPGINQEDLSLLFEAFSSLHAQNYGGTSGTGVGLFIARKLVELHGGQLHVKTKLGTGSNFWFELPVIKPEFVNEQFNMLSERIYSSN